VEWPEGVEEGFVDHLETQRYADRSAKPTQVERDSVVMSNRKDQSESKNLCGDIREEKLKLPVLPATKHDYANRR
jgi:hypothetical protein